MLATAPPPTGGKDSVIEIDALVIGAGPVGLWQVFQLGLQGIAAQVVDALPVPGGQCIELYADKPIYDIPGLPVCTGRELVDRLLQQIRPFAPVFHGGQLIASVQPQPEGGFAVASSTGRQWRARCLFIATGVGAFLPRTLTVAGAEGHVGRQLFYNTPPADVAGRRVLVMGGDDAALQTIVGLAELPPGQGPSQLTLLHRRATLNAEPALLQRWQALLATGAVRIEVGQIVALIESSGAGASASGAPLAAASTRLDAVQIVDDEGRQRPLPVDSLVVCLGLSPRLGPVAQWGLDLQRRQLRVDAAHFETSVPGIFAVGDGVSYPGKKKLILCGFHEATLATFAALRRLRPGEAALLQYTTTSALLQQRLGLGADRRPGIDAPPAGPVA